MLTLIPLQEHNMKYHYETEDHDLAHKIHGVIREHHGASSKVAEPVRRDVPPAPAPAVPIPATVGVVVPPPPPHVAPPAAVAPPPVVAPPPPPPTIPVSEPPPGWTVEHIKSAAEAFSKDPSKGGPAAMKTILERFGCKRATQCDPAKWPDLYAALTS